MKNTSINAYRQTAPERLTLRHRIARYILARTIGGRRVTRKDIARALELEASTVAGRVNEIEKSGIELDGVPYRIEYAGKQKDPVTGVSVETFGLVVNRSPQIKLEL